MTPAAALSVSPFQVLPSSRSPLPFSAASPGPLPASKLPQARTSAPGLGAVHQPAYSSAFKTCAAPDNPHLPRLHPIPALHLPRHLPRPSLAHPQVHPWAKSGQRGPGCSRARAPWSSQACRRSRARAWGHTGLQKWPAGAVRLRPQGAPRGGKAGLDVPYSLSPSRHQASAREAHSSTWELTHPAFARLPGSRALDLPAPGTSYGPPRQIQPSPPTPSSWGGAGPAPAPAPPSVQTPSASAGPENITDKVGLPVSSRGGHAAGVDADSSPGSLPPGLPRRRPPPL